MLRLRATLDTTGTFKVKKSDLASEACDPHRISDPLYLDDPREATYRPLDIALHDELLSGAIRL